MKRRFVLPAAFSLTFLAFLFFGFTKTRIPVLTAAKPPIIEYAVVPSPPEIPPEPVETGKTMAKNPAPPSQPEPVNPVDHSNMIESALLPRPEPLVLPGNPTLINPGIFQVGEEGNGVPGGSPVIDATLLDATPRARTQSPPIYPSIARVAGLNGEVIVEFVVDRNGRVLSPRIVRSSDPVFDESALRAVAKWIFEPGKKNSRPVSFRMVVPVRYRVSD